MAAKILVMGASGSGKSSLLQRYVEDKFDEGDCTYASEFHKDSVDAHDQQVELQIYHKTDVSSVEMENVVGIVFVFDVTSQESFDALAPLVEAMNTKLKPTLSAAICCNKVEDDNKDDRVITFMACKDVYSAQIPVFETSAKSGKNVKTVFNNLKMLCVEDIPEPPKAAKKKKGCTIS
mmetsp:Transcript_11186/g.45519  ORF Transcript_11186/g.45519 Transcript_11186/m.45519 type:complete len:178 (-) Transcript_11186:179-712(-)